MPNRRFPTDAEVERFIASHFVPNNDPRLTAGAKRAHRERVELGDNIALHGVSQGEFRWAVLSTDKGNDQLRLFVRMYLAAESAGISPLCNHVWGDVPVFAQCDPPIAVCTSCMAATAEAASAIGFFWNFVCDACGADSKLLSSTTVGAGNIMLTGHLCRNCSDWHRRSAAQEAEQVIRVGRNEPCACGSGQKYKHCHGAPHITRSNH